MSAPNTPYGQPSLLEKLGFIPILLWTVVAGISALVVAPFRDCTKTAPTTFRYVCYAMLRSAVHFTSVAQMQWVLPQTTEGYMRLATDKGFQPSTVIHSVTKSAGHYIGSKNAKVLLIYYHGGGYVMPASSAHLEYLFRLVSDINKTTKNPSSFAVLLLAYGLAPQVRYPTPMAQAAECLNDILKQGRDPRSILLGGDSAGANLCLSIISHMLHPHPSSSVPNIGPLTKPLGGAIVISPWVEFDIMKRESMKSKYLSDVSSPQRLASWVPAFMANIDRQSDNYIEPVKAGKNWWQGLEEVVSDVLVWGGGGEVLIDGIKIVMQDMKDACPDHVTTIVGNNECHEVMVVDVMLGYQKGDSAILIEEWVKRKIV